MSLSIYNILLSSLEQNVNWTDVVNNITRQLETGKVGKLDLISAFIQFVFFKKSGGLIPVPQEVSWPGENEWTQLGFSVSPVQNYFLINRSPWNPTWLTGINERNPFSDIYRGNAVNRDEQTPIDKLINEVTGYNNYKNAGQTAAVRALLLSGDQNPLLTILPTGTGKSLLFQVSTLMGNNNGMTVVIVPTVSLALDQARRMSELLRGLQRESFDGLLAWHSGLRPEQKSSIKEKIRNGTLPILFCSPEAAKGSLLLSLFNAATSGYIKRFFVDEVHMVVEWGNDFREAFQLLGGVVRGLQECSNKRIKIVLASATITESCYKDIEDIFCLPGQTLDVVHAVKLREEPEYWKFKAENQDEKYDKVKEVICNAPKPLIVYFSIPDEANLFAEQLKTAGYKRYAVYTGQTSEKKREQIIRSWNNDEIDIMLANSAFGVGMDKDNVRVVIHACVPETMDRFYQEVGRSGRDGRRSSSIVIYTDKDLQDAQGLNNKTILLSETVLNRWDTLRHNTTETIHGTYFIDLTRIPPPFIENNSTNMAWNRRTLILLERAGFIRLHYRKPNIPEDIEPEEQKILLLKYFNTVEVEILDPSHANINELARRIDPIRDSIKQSSANNLNYISQRYLKNSEDIGEILSDLYHIQELGISVSPVCRGCNNCRDDNRFTQHNPSVSVKITVVNEVTNAPDLFYDFTHQVVVVTYKIACTHQEKLQFKLNMQGLICYLIKMQNVRVIEMRAEYMNDFSPKYHESGNIFYVSKDFKTSVNPFLERYPKLSLLDHENFSGKVFRPSDFWTNVFNIVIIPEDMRDYSNRVYKDVALNQINLEDLIARKQNVNN